MSDPAPVPTAASSQGLSVEFCGEWFLPVANEPFMIGRGGALHLTDNPFLHRQFLMLAPSDGLWWLSNIGSRLTATVTDGSGGLHAWLGPGSRLPIVFGATVIIFTAGPTTYELTVHASLPAFHTLLPTRSALAETTIGSTTFTPSQFLLILCLAEPMLRRHGTGMSDIPSSAAAAARLGWTLSRFTRKLDNVCDKLDRAGVQGLRGEARALASNRRVRLVEYAVSGRLVTAPDLALLDVPAVDRDRVPTEGTSSHRHPGGQPPTFGYEGGARAGIVSADRSSHR